MKVNINLVEEIIDKIPNNLNSSIEKARFIYIQLAKILEFSTTYHNTNKFNQFIIKNRRYNIYMLDDNQVVCHNWADIYVLLLKKIGIKACKVSKHHAWVIIQIDDMLIYADATIGSYTDLSRIKNNDFIINFYPVSSLKTDGLPQKMYSENFSTLMKEVDKKIGYQPNQYRHLKQLKYEVSKFKTLKEKVKYILTDFNNINCGYYEGISYIQYLFSLCLDIDERKNISMSELKKTTENGTVDLVKCILVLENDSYEYYLFQNNKVISQKSKNDILNYANNNYGISSEDNLHKLLEYPLIFQIPKNIDFSIFNSINFIKSKSKNLKR